MEFVLNATVGENYTFHTRTIDLIVHNISQKPKKVKLAGKKIPINWNEMNSTVQVSVKWVEGLPVPISIKL